MAIFRGGSDAPLSPMFVKYLDLCAPFRKHLLACRPINIWLKTANSVSLCSEVADNLRQDPSTAIPKHLCTHECVHVCPWPSVRIHPHNFTTGSIVSRSDSVPSGTSLRPRFPRNLPLILSPFSTHLAFIAFLLGKQMWLTHGVPWLVRVVR